MVISRMYEGTMEHLQEEAVVRAAAEVHFAEQHRETWSISLRMPRSQVSDEVANALEDPVHPRVHGREYSIGGAGKEVRLRTTDE